MTHNKPHIYKTLSSKVSDIGNLSIIRIRVIGKGNEENIKTRSSAMIISREDWLEYKKETMVPSFRQLFGVKTKALTEKDHDHDIVLQKYKNKKVPDLDSISIGIFRKFCPQTR